MRSAVKTDYMQKKVLVIDDDEGILESLEVALAMEGYEVETMSEGHLSFEKAALSQPDLIILDVLLSGKDGRDITKKLKKQTATKHIPIVMISAHPNIKESTIKAGADFFLSKPFDMHVLFSTVEKLLK